MLVMLHRSSMNYRGNRARHIPVVLACSHSHQSPTWCFYPRTFLPPASSYDLCAVALASMNARLLDLGGIWLC